MGRVVEIGTSVDRVHDYTSGVFCMGRVVDASLSALSLLVQGSDRPRDHTAVLSDTDESTDGRFNFFKFCF